MLEYHENREEVISQQYETCGDIEAALSSASKSIKDRYKRGYPFADTERTAEIIQEAAVKITASIHEAQAEYPNLLKNDYLRERTTYLFSSHIV